MSQLFRAGWSLVATQEFGAWPSLTKIYTPVTLSQEGGAGPWPVGQEAARELPIYPAAPSAWNPGGQLDNCRPAAGLRKGSRQESPPWRSSFHLKRGPCPDPQECATGRVLVPSGTLVLTEQRTCLWFPSAAQQRCMAMACLFRVGMARRPPDL